MGVEQEHIMIRPGFEISEFLTVKFTVSEMTFDIQGNKL